MQDKIKEISERVLSTCNQLLDECIAGRKKDYIFGEVWINDKYYIFIDCDSEPGGINYFWFSLERAEDEESIDEQDTNDISDGSILGNIKFLLNRNEEILI